MMVLFATAPDDDEGVTLARAWIRQHGLTGEDARLVKRDGCVAVIDKGAALARIGATDGDR